MSKQPVFEIGQRAPDFSLLNQDGERFSPESLAGQWFVLYFYPKDDTPGCTIEAQEFSDELSSLEASGALVFGCSPDSVESHRIFIAKYGLKVHLLADPDRAVMKAYGAWGKKNMYGRISEGVIRSTVLIDPQGRVAHHWRRARAKGHAEKVRQKIESLLSKG